MKDNQKDLKVKDNQNGQKSQDRPNIQDNPKKGTHSSKQATMADEDEDVLTDTEKGRDYKGNQSGPKTPAGDQDRKDTTQGRGKNENDSENRNRSENQNGSQAKKQGGGNGSSHKS